MALFLRGGTKHRQGGLAPGFYARLGSQLQARHRRLGFVSREYRAT